MLEERLQKRQVKEFLGVFGNLVDNCFTACINDFTSKSLTNQENGCIARCVQKSMALQGRLSERFQEQNAQMTAQMQNR